MSFQGVLDRLLRHVDGLFLGLLGSCCLRLVSSGSEGSWGAFDSRTVWILKAHRLGFRVSSLFFAVVFVWDSKGVLGRKRTGMLLRCSNVLEIGKTQADVKPNASDHNRLSCIIWKPKKGTAQQRACPCIRLARSSGAIYRRLEVWC